MSRSTFQSGNTIRMTCEFRDFNDEVKDPDIVKIRFYRQPYVLLDEVVLGEENKISEGNYFYDYSIPEEYRGKIYYEWYGEISGSPSLKRDWFNVVFE